MKGKGKFIIIFVITIGIILVALPITIQAKGEVSNKVLDKYVAIGDDIAIEKEYDYDVSYVSLVKDFLFELNENLSYINLSEKGIDSSDLLNLINKNKDKIKNSNLITLSIGANNILNPILDNLNIDETILENCDEYKFNHIINEYLNSEEIKIQISNEINKFSKDFPKIIKKIKKLSPEADIYVNTIYNPINKKCDIYNFFDEKINLINDFIVENNDNYNYKIIDCYEVLNEDDALNFKIEDGVVRILDNKVGHAMMATQVISNYEEYVDLKIDDINSKSGSITGKTLPNSNIIIISENGAVGTTKAKSDGEFEVKIDYIDSGSTIEILVYDKKIFSILYKYEKLKVKKDLFI